MTAYDPPIVYHCEEGRLKVLSEEKGERSAHPLSRGLIMDPGMYVFDGKSYECEAPGVYRFSKAQQLNQQRIVISAGVALRTALYFSQVFIRGTRDDGLTVKKMERVAQERFLINSCGPATRFVHEMLRRTGFRSRIIHSHTLDEPNSYNNGHTMIEVYDEGKSHYELIDVDKKLYFHHPSQGILDLFGFCRAIDRGETINFKRFGQVPLVDWQGFVEDRTGFNYQFIEYMFHYDDKTLLNLYRRIAGIPVIDEKELFYATTWNDRREKPPVDKKKQWVVLSPEEFRKKFYQD
jgi:hypothetical protein